MKVKLHGRKLNLYFKWLSSGDSVWVRYGRLCLLLSALELHRVQHFFFFLRLSSRHKSALFSSTTLYQPRSKSILSVPQSYCENNYNKKKTTGWITTTPRCLLLVEAFSPEMHYLGFWNVTLSRVEQIKFDTHKDKWRPKPRTLSRTQSRTPPFVTMGISIKSSYMLLGRQNSRFLFNSCSLNLRD